MPNPLHWLRYWHARSARFAPDDQTGRCRTASAASLLQDPRDRPGDRPGAHRDCPGVAGMALQASGAHRRPPQEEHTPAAPPLSGRRRGSGTASRKTRPAAQGHEKTLLPWSPAATPASPSRSVLGSRTIEYPGGGGGCGLLEGGKFFPLCFPSVEGEKRRWGNRVGGEPFFY
jgi:hypothetical protein